MDVSLCVCVCVVVSEGQILNLDQVKLSSILCSSYGTMSKLFHTQHVYGFICGEVSPCLLGS